jgi:hypothetical protein
MDTYNFRLSMYMFFFSTYLLFVVEVSRLLARLHKLYCKKKTSPVSKFYGTKKNWLGFDKKKPFAAAPIEPLRSCTPRRRRWRPSPGEDSRHGGSPLPRSRLDPVAV